MKNIYLSECSDVFYLEEKNGKPDHAFSERESKSAYVKL